MRPQIIGVDHFLELIWWQGGMGSNRPKDGYDLVMLCSLKLP